MGTTQNQIAEKPLGYQQIVAGGLDASVGFASVPDGTVLVIIAPEVQNIRWRDDGVAPTAAIGMPLAAGATFLYTGRAAKALRFISQTAGAVLNATFYGASA